MRVIAGKYKGMTLTAPSGEARPTLDRTKETLFNILNFKLQNAAVLDLFAGSGQLAIESLSRGAKKAVLCDNNALSIAAIKRNFLKIGEIPNIVFGDYKTCLCKLDTTFDVIFVDPPYQSAYYDDVLKIISDKNLLSEDGIVVCEHAAADDLLEAVGYLSVYDIRKIGSVKFDFYKRSK